MKTEIHPEALVREAKPHRLYPSSIQKIARHFWITSDDTHVLELADELQRRPEVAVIAITGNDASVSGILRRDHLFNLIGRPFGREVLQRSRVGELSEAGEKFNYHEDIFSVAQKLRSTDPKEETDADQETSSAESFFPLVDEKGCFQGIFSSQDLSAYLSRITQDDIALAGRLQERLLAGNDLASVTGVKLEAWSRSARGVGGDFYFVKDLGNGRTFAALCDVSGKGVAASLIVSMVWGMLGMYDYRRGLKELLIQLNRSVITTFCMEKYLTGFFLIHDSTSGRLISADMGHSHALLVRNGKAHRVRSSHMNLPLGIENTLEPAISSYHVKPGDALFLYSDGLTEQEGREGTEFGEGRLYREVVKGLGEVEPLTETLPAAIDRFRDGVPQQDDMSFLLLRTASAPIV